jgi:DNA-binding beta-propeller fold protein YncE
MLGHMTKRRRVDDGTAVSTGIATDDKGPRDDEEDTVAITTMLNHPCGVAEDRDGNILVADNSNRRIRKITPHGLVSTLAGTGEEGYRDGEGTTVAMFAEPIDIAVDGDGNIVVADLSNHCVRKITPQGLVSTLAGTGEGGHRDGEGTLAQFKYPSGITVDGDGNVFVADSVNHRVRKITPRGIVSTLAGTGEEGHRDGEGNVAQFNFPSGIAVDGDGNAIVADQNNNRIRKITPHGLVSTLAGTGEEGHRDGEGITFAQFDSPRGVAVDGDGNVIVNDIYNHCIRKITPQGLVSTLLADTGEEAHQEGDGGASPAQFGCPVAVAVNGNGKVIVADSQNHCICRVI